MTNGITWRITLKAIFEIHWSTSHISTWNIYARDSFYRSFSPCTLFLLGHFSGSHESCPILPDMCRRYCFRARYLKPRICPTRRIVVKLISVQCREVQEKERSATGSMFTTTPGCWHSQNIGRFSFVRGIYLNDISLKYAPSRAIVC